MAEKYSPKQFGKLNESRGYDTGYRKHYYDLEVPDRLPHEPYNIRVDATETGTNRWTIRTTHGPHEERDPSGSYYKSVGESEQFEGPAGKVNTLIKKKGHDQFRNLVGGRP